ncbi:MAG: glycosyltransferase family 4 protein [Micrococcales bacterium]|nr:glycosyltransferase family 4 protein [Micrococcales bacterium]MCL2667326.1 glycosyltransferase family 4 protein [Micrococcales bacterium]
MSRLVVAHPSPDLYGSDLQMLESVAALVADGWEVTVVLPGDGPLAPKAAATGAQVRLARFPVLRKALLHPARLVGFALEALRAVLAARRWLRHEQVDVLYVNTLTLPVWVLAGRLAGTKVLVHVHEAEDDAPVVLRAALTAPLLLAHTVVANSRAAAAALARPFAMLARRTQVVYNGVAGPPEPPSPPLRTDPLRLLLVGRLSPRKGTDVALEAVAQLVADGRDVVLDLAGTAFTGYEWFADQLAERAGAQDLAGRVNLRGYVSDRWAALAAADVVLVPSRVEPFGNTAVEAMLAARPVVVSATQGLVEIVTDGATGLRVPPDDPTALAAAVARLADDHELATHLATRGREEALHRFGVARYADDLTTAVRTLAEA